MLLRQSAVSSLTRDTIVEESDRMPTDIFPALIGSGEIGIGLDATGLQGLNARTRQYRDTYSLMYDRTATQDDLYIRRDAAVSQHEFVNKPLWNPATNFLLMPCGWLDYSLTIDGQKIDTRLIASEAKSWRRQFSPLTGIVHTIFRLGEVQVNWQVGTAPDSVEVDLACQAINLDGKVRKIILEIRCHQTTRAGKALATGGIVTSLTHDMAFKSWSASTATSTAPILDPICISWALAAHGQAQYKQAPDSMSVHLESIGVTTSFGVRLVCGSDRNGSHSSAFAAQRVASYRAASIGEAMDTITAQWRAFFEKGAEIRIGDPLQEFLFLQSQYVLRAGGSWRYGLPMSTLWSQAITPATYWDCFFEADGMLRCGHIAEVRDLCRWLMKTAVSEGRPHYWMTYHNGVPVETYDKAYHVILAYAGVFIRLYEHSRDREDLEKLVYPYLRLVAQYAFDSILKKDASGWHLQGELAHDVDVKLDVTEQEIGILLWVAVSISKCAQYATELGKDDALIGLCREVDAHFRANPLDLSRPCVRDLWLPLLTGADPLADFESWWRMARERLTKIPMNFYTLHPWWNFAVAASLSQTGHPDLALEVQNDGLNSLTGLGYIDDVSYEAHGGGWIPMPTSTGPWLSAATIGFAHGGLWDDDVQVCVLLPKRLANQYLSWRGVTTLNGARISGKYDPQHLAVTVESARARRVLLRAPARIAGEPLAVSMDGQLVSHTASGETVIVSMPAGKHAISIERDMTMPADVIVAEPLDQGRKMVELLRQGGKIVRWTRNLESLPSLARNVRAMVLNSSYNVLPPDVAHGIEAAVRECGLTLITLFHAGCVNGDGAMAELTGVRADFDGTEREYWATQSVERKWSLTTAGQQLFPGIESNFTMPCTSKFIPHPARDVESLAIDFETGRAVITRRPVGKGQVFWIATGSKVMDFGVIDRIHWAARDLWMFGHDIQEEADLKWLRNVEFGKILNAIIGTG